MFVLKIAIFLLFVFYYLDLKMFMHFNCNIFLRFFFPSKNTFLKTGK